MNKKLLGIPIVLFLLASLVLGLAPASAQAPGPLDHVTITPASVALPPGGTQQFSAQGLDANNVPIPDQTFFWTVVAGGGSIGATTGLFTAGSVLGSFPNTVQAIAVQGAILKMAFASVTVTAVTPGALDHVTITPASATLSPGATRQFSAQGYDANNVPIPGLTYFWNVTAGGGTITAAGLFTAGNVPGTYANTVQAIAVQGNVTKWATASVTVTGVAPAALKLGIKRLVLLVAASLGGIGFEDFLGAQWTVKEDGTTATIKAIPGVVKATSATSLTLLPNGQTQTTSFTLTPDSVVLAGKGGLKMDDRAVVVTVNEQVRLVVEVPLRLPPGLKKHGPFDRFVDRFMPPGWFKGKKMGWDDDRWDWDDDDDDWDDDDDDDDDD